MSRLSGIQTIAVLYSIPTAHAKTSGFVETDEDTGHAARLVHEALTTLGYASALAPIAEDNIELVRTIKADMIFDLIEWTGLDLPLSMKVLDILEAGNIPFTGATKYNFLYTADKVLMKDEMKRLDISTADYRIIRTNEDITPEKFEQFPYPGIVKLSLEHCSIGLSPDSIVHSYEEMKNKASNDIIQFHQPVLVEHFVSGREFQVTILERDGVPVVLPIVEIVFDWGHESFLTYDSRWDESHDDYKFSHVRLNQINDTLKQKIELTCLDAYKKLQFSDYTRVDLREEHGEVYILEPNSNPGLDDDDAYSMTVAYRAAGMTFADFIDAIVRSCARRFGVEKEL